jgi:GntR family transcriptional repressor for pyruvate dehydrogenase complex
MLPRVSTSTTRPATYVRAFAATKPHQRSMRRFGPDIIRSIVDPDRSSRRPQSVTTEAIAKIRDQIASGAWGPGTRLPREADLAADLGISRNSLREAVRALALANVLEVRQGDGTYISTLEPDLLLGPTTELATSLLRGQNVIELFEVRRLLEPEAAALAAERRDSQLLAELERALSRMFAAEQRVEDHVDADVAFHDVIARASGNEVLRSLIASLASRTTRIRVWRGLVSRGSLEEARSEHRRIYEAIASGDPAVARAATTLHLASTEQWLREHLDDVPETLDPPDPEARRDDEPGSLATAR